MHVPGEKCMKDHNCDCTSICHSGCNRHQLSDDNPLPTSVTCGASMHSLGISNGIVCYSGVDTGAIAVYSCFSCTSGITERSPSFRTCLENGTWNGTIPQCECDGMISKVSDS